jgi:malate/lactate dehydrogenase
MARSSFKMPEDFLLKVSTLAEKTDEIIPKVLEAGGEVVKAKVKSNLQASIGNDTKLPSRSTGELIDALGVTPAGVDRDGNYNVKVGFDEPRKDGESNAKLLASRLSHS